MVIHPGFINSLIAARPCRWSGLLHPRTRRQGEVLRLLAAGPAAWASPINLAPL